MPPSASSSWQGRVRLGRVAGSEVYVSGSWFVVAIVVAVALAPRVDQVEPGLGAARYVVGLAFAVALYGAVLLHEISHAVVARHYGHVVRSITLSFMGGRTEVEGEAETPAQEFWTAVVGPITSLAVGGLALAARFGLDDGVLALIVEALAFSNLLLGLMNLLPALPLDGGRVLKAAVWAVSGSPLRGVLAAGWGGRVAAVVILLLPVLAEPLLGRTARVSDVLVALLIGGFLWLAANAEMRNAVFRSRVSGLRARDLARPALAVPDHLPLAEALRRAQEAGATALVTTDSLGRQVGVVNEDAVAAVPVARRPWVSVSTVARTLEPGLVLSSALAGRGLLEAVNEAPAAEYVLQAEDGALAGVLAVVDLDRAFRAR